MSIDSRLKVASGRLCLAGKMGSVYTGSGQVILRKAPRRGMDTHLFSVLTSAADDLRLVLEVNSVDTALNVHAPGSRHASGRAVDMNKIGPFPGVAKQATLNNPHAMKLVQYLRVNGWHVGEGGNWPAILFGSVHTSLNPSIYDHSTHLHVSIARQVLPGSAGDDVPDGSLCDAELSGEMSLLDSSDSEPPPDV